MVNNQLRIALLCLQFYAVVQGMNSLLCCVNFVLKKITDSLMHCSFGLKSSNGGLQLSFIIVATVLVQLLVTTLTSHTVILLLLMTSGDVERNPGPLTNCGNLLFSI